jgi:acyl carrier protein
MEFSNKPAIRRMRHKRAGGSYLKCSLFEMPTSCQGTTMDVTQEVLRVLDEVLSLNGRSKAFTRDTPLLGSIAELDSMAVVTLITSLEEQFGLVVDDDDIDGSTFATVGSLADFVGSKLTS